MEGTVSNDNHHLKNLSACGTVRDFIANFSNPVRLRIMCALMEQGEASVAQLVLATGARQPAVSQNLKQLRLSGIVNRRRVGTSNLYRISDPNAEEMMEFIFRLSTTLVPKEAVG